jgi:hypothetical protein
MDEDASFATLGSGNSAGNNNRRISSSNTERHLEKSTVFCPTKKIFHCRIVMMNYMLKREFKD